MTTCTPNWPNLVVLRDRAQASLRLAAEAAGDDLSLWSRDRDDYLIRCVYAGKDARDAARAAGHDGSGCFAAAIRAIDDEALACFDGREEKVR